MHAIDDILPVIEPEPATILFETTDFLDLKLGDYYLKSYGRFFDGENTFVKIKWEGNYLLYYLKDVGSLINDDCLSMMGWWSISITFPKVMKGKYEVFIFQPNWGGLPALEVCMDGVIQPHIYNRSNSSNGGLQKIGDVDFPTTAEHTIKVRNLSAGAIFWDYVLFEPVK